MPDHQADPARPPAAKLTLLVDDLRVFRDGRPAVVVRRSDLALEVLREHATRGTTWAQMWLDHDLGDATGTSDTVMPVIDWLCRRALADENPVPVDVIYVHSSNQYGADTMVAALRRAGYPVRRMNATDELAIDAALYDQVVDADSGADPR